MEIKFNAPQKNMGTACETILRTVPEWFGKEESLLEYVKEIDQLETYTASVNGQIVGFFSVSYHNEKSAELHVLAVDAKYHNKKIGSQLYGRVEQALKQKGVSYIQVKTVGEGANDANYEKTRFFYASIGFEPLQLFTTLWGPEAPCLLMIKVIS